MYSVVICTQKCTQCFLQGSMAGRSTLLKLLLLFPLTDNGPDRILTSLQTGTVHPLTDSTSEPKKGNVVLDSDCVITSMYSIQCANSGDHDLSLWH